MKESAMIPRVVLLDWIRKLTEQTWYGRLSWERKPDGTLEMVQQRGYGVFSLELYIPKGHSSPTDIRLRYRKSNKTHSIVVETITAHNPLRHFAEELYSLAESSANGNPKPTGRNNTEMQLRFEMVESLTEFPDV